MAATEVNLLFTGRGGKDTWEHRRTYTRIYEVLTNDPNDDEQIVGNAEGVPIRGQVLSSDPEAVVISVDPQQSDDSPCIWYVTIEYDTDPPQTSDRTRPDQRADLDGNPISKTDRPTNPLNEPATWTLDFYDTEEPVSEGTRVNDDGELELPVPPQWVGNRGYPAGSYVKNGLNVYFQTAPRGVTGPTGPTGKGTGIETAPTAWVTSHAYSAGDYVTNGGNVYSCTAGGASAAAGGGPSGEGGDITDGGAKWEYAGVPAVWDFFGLYSKVINYPEFAIMEAVLNSARFAYDPPAMTTVSRPVITVTKNMPGGTIEDLMALRNAQNLYTWRGIPPRCARIKHVTHDGGKVTNGVSFVTSKWVIELDPDTFDVRLLDQGFGRIETVKLSGGGTKKAFVRFKDANGEPMDEPTLLDGGGSPLKPGDPPVFRRYVPRQVQLIDFNSYLPF